MRTITPRVTKPVPGKEQTMSRGTLTACTVCLLSAALFGQIAGYDTQLAIDGPVPAGENLTVTGGGAPGGPGIWVELWRMPAGSTVAAPVMSVPTDGAGAFAFPGVTAQPGDGFYVTLSRSWQFSTDGDLAGWDIDVNDCMLEVSEGALIITVFDNNGDGWRDPYLRNDFEYDPAYYRVVEIRLRNPAPAYASGGALLGLFWGAPWGMTIAEHNAVVPADMNEFTTVLIPMDKDERSIVPGPPDTAQDGLWAPPGALNSTLRIDPINGWPHDDPDVDGEMFEIDYIRLREDLRWEFANGDLEGIDQFNTLDSPVVTDGFLTYVVAGDSPDPSFFRGFDTGAIGTEYFTRFCIGYENPQIAAVPPEGGVGLYFADADSDGYWDDGGPADATTLQVATALLPYTGRVDAAFVLDELTVPPGEWTEDNRVRIGGLRLDLPELASTGDRIALDYYGFIPDNPYGPSPVVTAGGASETAFKRGDTNDDGSRNVADAVFLLMYIFSGGEAPPCLDAGDTNDDGSLNVADAVFLLMYIFSGGAPLPAPLNTCGPDPTPETPDEITCARFDHC
jgi:hypothetical protein